MYNFDENCQPGAALQFHLKYYTCKGKCSDIKDRFQLCASRRHCQLESLLLSPFESQNVKCEIRRPYPRNY